MTERDAFPEENDHELVFRVKNGDNSAFDQLMLRHQLVISSHMRRYSASSHTVEELTQTVFVKAYTSLSGYKPIAPFINWLKTIASRVGYDHWRQEKKSRGVLYQADMDVFTEHPSQQEDMRDEFDRLSRVINKLGADERQVLYMLHVDGVSIADIAAIMGWNRSMTKMRAFRARNKLRKLLLADGQSDRRPPNA